MRASCRISRRRGDEEEHLAVDEMERVEAETRRDRRTRGEAQDDAAEHQRTERGERQPVDRPPPFAQRRWLCARGHGVPKPKSPPYWWHRHGFQGIKKSLKRPHLDTQSLTFLA